MLKIARNFSGIGILTGLAMMCFTAGCEHADPLSVDTSAPTLSNIQAAIFDTNCALSTCHDGSGSSLPGILDLRAGRAYANLVGVRSLERADLFRVTPNDPDNSYLVKKIQGDPDVVGFRMPFGRLPLSQEQIDLVREWIALGAPDN